MRRGNFMRDNYKKRKKKYNVVLNTPKTHNQQLIIIREIEGSLSLNFSFFSIEEDLYDNKKTR